MTSKAALWVAGLVGLSAVCGRGAQASTALVFDPHTGLVLYSENPDRKWYPASITKLMTAYVTFEALKEKRVTPETKLTTTEFAYAQDPTKIWLRLGTQLNLSSALGVLIVKSANDVAVMLADGVGGTLAKFTSFGACRNRAGGNADEDVTASAPHPMSEFQKIPSGLGAARYDDAVQSWERCRYDAFIQRMNETARRLGMTNTTFANPNGLPDAKQVTTARDMGFLARAIIKDYPDHAELFSRKFTRLGGRKLRSYNSLLRTFEGADGMKTGFTCASGYNIVASATRDGRKIVAVVLGWTSSGQRNERTKKLLEYGFEIFPWKVALRGSFIDTMPQTDDADQAPGDLQRKVRSRSCGNKPIRARARRKKRRKFRGKTKAKAQPQNVARTSLYEGERR